MNESLVETAYSFLRIENTQERIEAEHYFVELLTFSSSSEITTMLDKVLADDWIGFPVWVRNLAFRLGCLLEPANAQLRRRAAADLRCFGPDWDLVADILDREADKIEGIDKRSANEKTATSDERHKKVR